MPPNVKSSAQPGRPCALFLMPPELDRPLLQQPVRPPFSTRDDDGIPSGSAALGARPGWWGAACLLLQRGLECGWTHWGLDAGLVLLLLAASMACTAPTLALLPFVVLGMMAPRSKRR